MTKKTKVVVGVVAFLVLVLAVSSLGFYTPPWWEKDEGAFAIVPHETVSGNYPDWVVRVINTGLGRGIIGRTDSTTASMAAVYGNATKTARGVHGQSKSGVGVFGASSTNIGVYGQSGSGSGIKAAVYGNATNVASGVMGRSVSGDGGNFSSTNGIGIYVDNAGSHGVHVNSASDHGVYVGNAASDGFKVGIAGQCGVNIGSAGNHGVNVGDATNWGGYFNGDIGGVWAGSDNGHLFEAWDTSTIPSNRRFYVDNAGQVYADGTFHGGGADFAEMLSAAEGLEPGDVLVIGADGKLARSSNTYSTAVVGVYSTSPGFVGGAGDDEDLTGKVPLAVVGVVPVKASAENGSISPGDLLTTSSIPGHAMKAAEPKVGSIIGKAMESLESGSGTIKMLVTLQ